MLLAEGEADQIAAIASSPGVVAALESGAEVAFDVGKGLLAVGLLGLVP